MNLAFNEPVWQKLKELEALYRSSKLDRYRFQDALSHLYAQGTIPYELFSMMNDIAVTDALVSLP